MKCSGTTVEIETLVSRINRKSIDLQPEFQRGEVWDRKKKQKLIDSILRGWTIPPILLIKNGDKCDLVLDGQQRLVAIRDFCNNAFSIDGGILPHDDYILQLDKLDFSNLPNDIKEKFYKYTINFVYLEDYKPSEPAELFERFNQPMKLSPAEQRNAYMGKARSQVKSLVQVFSDACMLVDNIRFNNNRLVYDDLISKFCYTLQVKNLDKKITTSDITGVYRSEEGFDDFVVEECERIMKKFIRLLTTKKTEIRFSSASIFTWWIFLFKNKNLEEYDLVNIMYYFENICEKYRGKNNDDNIKEILEKFSNDFEWCNSLFLLYIQRMAYANTDPLSIKTRDLLLTIFGYWLIGDNVITISFDKTYERLEKNFIEAIIDFLSINNWGRLSDEK